MKPKKRGVRLLIGVALASMLVLTSCKTPANRETETEQVVTSFVGALKKGDINSAQQYMSLDAATIQALDQPETKTIATLWFSQVDVSFPEHIGVATDATTATVRANVSAPDAQALVARIEEQSGRKLSEAAGMSEKEVTALLSSIMIDVLKGDLPKVSREIDVSLEKNADGQWQIVPDAALLGALGGGLDQLKIS